MSSGAKPTLTVKPQGQTLEVTVALAKRYGIGVIVVTDTPETGDWTTDTVFYEEIGLSTPVTFPVEVVADTTWYIDWRDRGEYTVTTAYSDDVAVDEVTVVLDSGLNATVAPLPSAAVIAAYVSPAGA